MAERETTILVVEDEPEVRFVLTEALELEGFSVVAAGNGAEAMDILRSNPNIGVLFTDIVMPGALDGFQLAHEAKQFRPDLSVIYTSGYIKELPWGRHGVGYGPMLPKPYQHRTLFSALRTAMGSGSGSIQ